MLKSGFQSGTVWRHTIANFPQFWHMIAVRDPGALYNKSKFTIEEFLEFEKSSPEKHEFYKGEIFLMSGASARHNVIFSNLFGALTTKLKGTPCKPYGSDLHIHVVQNTLFNYPYISVICGKIVTSPLDEGTAVETVVLVEILRHPHPTITKATKSNFTVTYPR